MDDTQAAALRAILDADTPFEKLPKPADLVRWKSQSDEFGIELERALDWRAEITRIQARLLGPIITRRLSLSCASDSKIAIECADRLNVFNVTQKPLPTLAATCVPVEHKVTEVKK